MVKTYKRILRDSLRRQRDAPFSRSRNIDSPKRVEGGKVVVCFIDLVLLGVDAEVLEVAVASLLHYKAY